MTEFETTDGDVGEETHWLSERVSIWREYVGEEDVAGEAERIAGALLDTIAATNGDEEGGEDVRPRLEELAARGQLGDAWTAVETLHLALDRAVADVEIEGGDAIRLRRRLTELQARLHRAGLGARLAARRELLRDITHDLRVPLNSIVFLTDSLFDERHGELSEPQKRKLRGVYSASTTLLNFVNDLLDLSQSTEEDFECSSVPFSIRGVLDDARHLVRPVADYHGADFQIELRTEDSWEGDPRLVRRVLLNLVTNGLEAAGDGGAVTVTVGEGDVPGSGMRRIVVADTGPGIDVERAEALLDAGDESGWKELIDGTDGLGLLIIGRLVRAAGGEVEVEAEDGVGTRVSVHLPFGGEGDDEEG